MKNNDNGETTTANNGKFEAVPCITGFGIALIGVALLVLGIQLITLGGSWYYAVAGLGLIISGILFIKRKYEGICVYVAIFIGTIIWAVWEVGFDGWKLMPRLLMPAVLGIWMGLPVVTNRLLENSDKRDLLRRSGWFSSAFCLLIAIGVIALGYHTSALRYQRFEEISNATSAAAPVNPPVADGDWQFYGRTANGDRFSPLAEITPENVSKLKLSWKTELGDLPYPQDLTKGREFNFEDTPTKIGDNLYVCTPHHQVLSLNATTGKINWKYDPHSDTDANIFLACRGVAYYETPQTKTCKHRIITTTGGPEMIALDADTGKLCDDFGNHGTVSLTDHMGDVPPGFHFITSQPLVLNDRIILGGWIYDDQTTGEPSGVVRAYDPTTGNLAWAWDLGRANPNAPLKPGEIYTRGTPNAWGTYTADPKLGLVYLPMGNTTPDYFDAGRTPAENKYSSAVVALDIKTGKERWVFQTVHHDMWDFDLPIGPSLVDMNTPQGVVPALVQVTKRGDFFVLDRRNGQPITDIKEVPVPQVAAVGEILSPTQPYQTGIPSLAPPDVKETDLWGATPIDQLLCRIDFHQRHYQGKFTAPQLGKYLAYPAFDGVIDWYGSSIDQAHQLLIANSSYMPMVMDFMTHEDAQKKGFEKPWAGWGKEQYPKLKSVAYNPEYGTPYFIKIEPWLNALGVPCLAPPWGALTAIDLNTRKVVWERPLGTTRKSGLFNTHFGIPLPTGIVGMGGNIITGSGLIFIGSTADSNFRAFDEKTGKLLWQSALPAGGNATPATYTGADGRQYVVIVAGGHGGLRTVLGDYIMAYALPNEKPDANNNKGTER